MALLGVLILKATDNVSLKMNVPIPSAVDMN